MGTRTVACSSNSHLWADCNRIIDCVYQHLDLHLEGKTYMVGNRRTIADAYAFPMLRWGNNLPKPLSEYPHLDRFYRHLGEDASVRQALKQQGIQG